MSDLRTAAQMALDALLLEATAPPIPETAAAIDALRAALAAEPQPVAEFVHSGLGNFPELQWRPGYMARVGDKFYTTAPTAQPLTDEQIESLVPWCGDENDPSFDRIQFARAIERAHGIGGTHG